MQKNENEVQLEIPKLTVELTQVVINVKNLLGRNVLCVSIYGVNSEVRNSVLHLQITCSLSQGSR